MLYIALEKQDVRRVIIYINKWQQALKEKYLNIVT